MGRLTADSTWESAFTAVDAQHAAETVLARADLDTEAGDDLAQTARRLLEAVQHDTSEKFQQSAFLDLMRQLRDKEAEVQQGRLVTKDTPAEARAGAGPPTQAQLDAMLSEATAARGAPQPVHADETRQAPPNLWHDMREFYAEEDAARAAAAHRAQHAFVGDGGDVAARMREDEMHAAAAAAQAAAAPRASSHELPSMDDVVGQEFHKWTSMGANVAGATSQWEESMDEDFVGRHWQGTAGRGLRGAQAAEWDKLQADWDAWDAQDAGMYPTVAERVQRPFPYERPAYQFHDANPYRGHLAPQHASRTTLDTVLEQEAAVQADPTDAGRWYALGLRQQENEREKQAIAALHKAAEVDPRMKDAWLALAVSYTNENDREEALEALERWVNLNDTYRGVVHAYQRSRDMPSNRHHRLANVLMAMARSGVPDTGEAVDADIQVALGVLFNASGEYDKAVDCFNTALSVRPDDWILYNRIGATLSNSGRPQDSLQYYYEALQLRPDFARCHFNLSISCLNLKVRRRAAHPDVPGGRRARAHRARAPKGVRRRRRQQQLAEPQPLGDLARVARAVRNVASHRSMRRPDLANLCAERDIDLIHLEHLVPDDS